MRKLAGVNRCQWETIVMVPMPNDIDGNICGNGDLFWDEGSSAGPCKTITKVFMARASWHDMGRRVIPQPRFANLSICGQDDLSQTKLAQTFDLQSKVHDGLGRLADSSDSLGNFELAHL